MGERLLCKQEVIGSIPFASTTRTAGAPARRVRGVLGQGAEAGVCRQAGRAS